MLERVGLGREKATEKKNPQSQEERGVMRQHKEHVMTGSHRDRVGAGSVMGVLGKLFREDREADERD